MLHRRRWIGRDKLSLDQVVNAPLGGGRTWWSSRGGAGYSSAGDKHWRAAASYVALTRRRESAQVFVAEDTARDAQQLARQMGRGEVRAASVAWATADELRPEQRPRTGEGQDTRGGPAGPPAPAARPDVRTGTVDPACDYWGQVAGGPAQTAAAPPFAAKAEVGQGQRISGWLIAPYADPSGRGRDSLGRGTSPGEIAAMVAADKAV